ncbi:MAG: trehalase [Acidobacteriia bacterium]|nr:trehalase [Terriglobia bacterium]
MKLKVQQMMKWPHLFFSLAAQMTLVLANGVNQRTDSRKSDPQPGHPGASESREDILRYISKGWDTLTRTMNRCDSLEDSKTDGEPVLYVPAELEIPPTLKTLQERCRVRVEHLPVRINEHGGIDLRKIKTEGLLYLENPYVVPGGQFNEMYGWDSYFIIRGLLRDNRIALAKGMVDNFFFEIEHYGGVLNANRTYYLTRSQPPFLTSMILAVYDAESAGGKAKLQWLEKAYHFAERDYRQWIQPPHLAGDTGLSRYFDHGDGPVPEIMGDPSHYYRGVACYFLARGGSYESFLIRSSSQEFRTAPGPRFPIPICSPNPGKQEIAAGAPAEQMALTKDFYKGDRSMRESGFDVTFRFGSFGAETHHFAPVCLNSLLYKTELDLAQMSLLLGHPAQARYWKAKAAARRRRIVKYFWDQDRGLFFDYDFTNYSRSTYEYATTFYPLWAGLASKEQAQLVAGNLHLFEQPGGLAMSRTESQAQWDFPYGWAPLQLLAVEGLRKYGYGAEADRISGKFLSTVLDNFNRDHNIREKYNVVTRSSETNILEGYSQNFTGFGWTNAVFLELLHESPGSLP